MPPQEKKAEGLKGFLPGGDLFTLTDFGGINTKSPRMSIEDNECSWLENIFPIGKGNARTMWGKGSAVYTQGGGKTIVMLFYYNIGALPYGLVVLNDGTAIQFRTDTGATTTITSTVSAFYNGGSLPGFAQYGSSGIVIVSPTTSNGYYAWDGTTLYSAGSTAPSWLSGLTSPLVYTGNTHTSITVDSMSSTTGLQVGMTVSGSGVQAGTTIASIVSATSITLSLATTTSVTTDSLTFNWPMPSGIKGTSIEIFQNRIWIANGTSVVFTAAGNGTSFSAANGGGSFTSTDSFLRQQYIALRQANGYLYIFGDSSINYIGNVQTVSANSVVTTTFNNLNTDPQTGTPWPYSVTAFGRALMLANTSGIYSMLGGSAEKASDKLNGLFSTATLPLTGVTNMPSGAVATVFGIRLFFLNITALDPFTNASRPMMCTWDGAKWFISSQESNCTFIATQELNSQLTAWGTDGTNVFPLFNQASSTLTKKWKTKQWSGKSMLIDKQYTHVYYIGYDNSGVGYNVNVTVDTDQLSSNAYGFSGDGTVTWQSVNGTVQFQNGTPANVYWTVLGISIIGLDNGAGYGKIIGLTCTTTSSDFVTIEQDVMYRDYRFYG